MFAEVCLSSAAETVADSSLIVCVVCTELDKARAEAITDVAIAVVATMPTIIVEIPKSLFSLKSVILLGVSTGTSTKRGIRVTTAIGNLLASQHKV